MTTTTTRTATPQQTNNNTSFPASFQFQRMGHLNTLNTMIPNNSVSSIPALSNLPKFPAIPSLPNISSLPSLHSNQPQQTVSFINNTPNTSQPQILVPIGNMNGSLNLNLRANNYYQPSFSHNYHGTQFQPLPPSTVILQTNGAATATQNNVNPMHAACNPPTTIQNINHTTHNHHNHNNNVIAFINQSQPTTSIKQQQQRPQMLHVAHTQNTQQDSKANIHKKRLKPMIMASASRAPKQIAKPMNIPRFIDNNERKDAGSKYVVKFKQDEMENTLFSVKLKNMKSVIFCEGLSDENIEKNSNCTNGKYHKCSKCDKKYKYLCNLRSHSKVHTNEAHVCEYCQKRFGRKANYQEHRRVHTGESPYTCNICNRSFKQRHGLKDHMRLRCNPK
eukprot:478335_1